MWLRRVLHILVFVGLTLVTQLGGFAYLIAILISTDLAKPLWQRLGKRVAVFAVLYGLLWLGAVYTAPVFGRVALPCQTKAPTQIVMQSPIYCALNRQYVTPQLKEVSDELAAHMAERFPGTHTLALDAGFPFLDGFPLLPHLSHDDGKKLDLAFWYKDANGAYKDRRTQSPIGYWAFVEPGEGAELPCSAQQSGLSLRWDMGWFQVFLNDLQLEEERTRASLIWLTTGGADQGVSRIFVEPHLVQRLGIESDVIRFQGCRAARHDDHIHFEIN